MTHPRMEALTAAARGVPVPVDGRVVPREVALVTLGVLLQLEPARRAQALELELVDLLIACKLTATRYGAQLRARPVDEDARRRAARRAGGRP